MHWKIENSLRDYPHLLNDAVITTQKAHMEAQDIITHCFAN